MNTYDVRLWCNTCSKVIGTVHHVDSSTQRRVKQAMEEHNDTHERCVALIQTWANGLPTSFQCLLSAGHTGSHTIGLGEGAR